MAHVFCSLHNYIITLVGFDALFPRCTVVLQNVQRCTSSIFRIFHNIAGFCRMSLTQCRVTTLAFINWPCQLIFICSVLAEFGVLSRIHWYSVDKTSEFFIISMRFWSEQKLENVLDFNVILPVGLHSTEPSDMDTHQEREEKMQLSEYRKLEAEYWSVCKSNVI